MTIEKLIYKFRQKMKQREAAALGMPLLRGIKEVEKRKYLTRTGIKNWDELTLEDKLTLNIKV